MYFEYDRHKSAANEAKHGINFDAAQALWDDGRLCEAPARTEGEPRFLAIGMMLGKHWTAVYAIHSDVIRRISVRRARPEEIERYEIQNLR